MKASSHKNEINSNNARRTKPLLGMGVFCLFATCKVILNTNTRLSLRTQKKSGPPELSSRIMPSLLLCSSFCHSFEKFTISFKVQKEILDVEAEISTSPTCRYGVQISIKIGWNLKFYLTEQVSDCFNLTLYLKELFVLWK